VAEAYKQSSSVPPKPISSGSLFDTTSGSADPTGVERPAANQPVGEADEDRHTIVIPQKPSTLRWSGEVPAQKWMNFYTKVLSRFATTKSLRLTVTVDVAPEGGVSKQAIEETKTALRELGLKDDL
jgi:hypothetical protein